jgi:hypothetical protein
MKLAFCAGVNSAAQYVRYAQSITLNIELQPDSGNGGLIYPPYLSIYYSWVSKADINSSTTVRISFIVLTASVRRRILEAGCAFW